MMVSAASQLHFLIREILITKLLTGDPGGTPRTLDNDDHKHIDANLLPTLRSSC